MKKSVVVLVALLFVNMPIAFSQTMTGDQLLLIKYELAEIASMIRDANPYRVDQIFAKIDIINGQIDDAMGGSGQRRRYTDSEVAELASKIKKAWPYNSQKPLIILAAKNAMFSMEQIRTIIDQLDFQNDKKEVLDILVPNAIDPQNIDLFFDIFWSQSDKDYLYNLVK